ncbi:MAG: GIY-YIG nuclease family protein [Rhizomicrobium sp.]
MDKGRRKEIARTYRERMPQQGIFAVRCAGRTWVSASRHLDTQQNRLWFGLRQGGLPNAELQAAWNAHGEAAFVFEVLEKVTDENSLLIDSLLKEREKHWRAALSADKVLG